FQYTLKIGAPNSLVGDLPEATLDQIQKRTRYRNEMKMEPRVSTHKTKAGFVLWIEVKADDIIELLDEMVVAAADLAVATPLPFYGFAISLHVLIEGCQASLMNGLSGRRILSQHTMLLSSQAWDRFTLLICSSGSHGGTR